MADDNNKTTTNTATAEFYAGEENGSGDIEQGRLIISENYTSSRSKQKQRRIRALLATICVFIAAWAAGLGVPLSRPAAAAVKITASPSMSLAPSQSPIKRNYECFADSETLKALVNRYVNEGCGALVTLCTDISDTYGWPIGSWCVDDITDMSELFRYLRTFDEDISGWNVGQVTDMEAMFRGASSFNQDLSMWNTSSVTTMSSMFLQASSFNGKISSWNTSAVTDMSWMFSEAS